MIVKVLCSALLFLAFATNAHGEPRLAYTNRRMTIFGTKKLNLNFTQTTLSVDDESLPYLESKKIDELVEVANHRDFRVSDVLKTLRAGQEPRGSSVGERLDESPRAGQDPDESQLEPDDTPKYDDQAEDNGPTDNFDDQKTPGGDFDDTVDQKNEPEDNDNTGDQHGGESNGNLDEEEVATEEDENGDEEFDDYDDEDDYEDDDYGDVGDQERHRDKKRPKQNNRSKSRNEEGSRGKSGTSRNSQSSRSNQNSQGSRSSQNSQDSRSNQNSQGSRSNQNSQGSRSNQNSQGSRSNQNSQGSRSNQNSQVSRSNQNSQASRSNQNSQASRPNQRPANSQPSNKPESTRTNQKAQVSQPKDRMTNSQRPGTKKTSAKSARRPVGSRRFRGGPRGRRLPGLRGRSSVFRQLTDKALKNFQKITLRDPKNRNPPLEPSITDESRNGKRFGAGEESPIGASSVTGIVPSSGGPVTGAVGGGGAIGGGLAGGGSTAVSIGGPLVVSIGRGILKKVVDIASPDINTGDGDDRRSYQPTKSSKGHHPKTANTGNRHGPQRPVYPDKVNLNDRRGPHRGRVDPNNKNINDRQPGQTGKDDHNNLSPDEDLLDRNGEDDPDGSNLDNPEPTQSQNGEDALDVPNSENPEPTQNGEDALDVPNSENPEPTQNGEDALDVPNSENPEPTQNGENDPDASNLDNPEPTQQGENDAEIPSPNEDLSNHNSRDKLDAPTSNDPELMQQGEDDQEKLDTNEDLSHKHLQQGDEVLHNPKPFTRPLTQHNNNADEGQHSNKEDSDEQSPDVVFEQYSPRTMQHTTEVTNTQGKSPTAIAEADIQLEKDVFRIIHHGDNMNITIKDFFGQTPRVNGVGKKCIRNNTQVDTLDYDPTVPIPGRNRFCEPENQLKNEFTVPPRCCGPQYACPLYIKYTGPGSGIDTAKNLAIQRDCRCELEFYKCLVENRDPSEMHPFFLFLYDSCLIKKADVSNSQPIGFRVINTAEFIAFPMYN